MTNTHGLATSIRSSQESETFDLGGQNASTITSTMEAAFSEPFQHSNFNEQPGQMIRLTFVTGAGKQARAKYDEGAAKALIAVLVKNGYKEDRGASCVVECAGTYKQQHDTGKNLKTVVVFPQVGGVSSPSGDGNADVQRDDDLEHVIPPNSPGYKIATATMTDFEKIVSLKCPSWSDKKGALGSLQSLQNILQSFEEKLMQGNALDDAEQNFYDAVVMLKDKEDFVKEQMHAQVESGNVTAREKDFLLHQVDDRIHKLQKDGKPTDKALQRKSMLQNIEPIEPHGLRYESQIFALRKEKGPLLQVEASAKGRLLSVKETQALSRKDEIEEEIRQLEEASQGWFEEDDTFQSRVNASRRKWNSMRDVGSNSKKSNSGNKSQRGGSGVRKGHAGAGSSIKHNTTSSWTTLNSGSTQGRKQGQKTVVRNGSEAKKASSPSDLFSALMMNDDDSSSSDD